MSEKPNREDVEEIVEERVEELEEQVEEMRDEFLKPAVVERVLVEAGLSSDRAKSLVETMQDVEEGLDDV